jgi:hypothetical protein
MANEVRIKRRSSGAAGAPATLKNAELAFNEVDDTLYYGKGTGGVGGSATTIEAIAGKGAYVDKTTDQTIDGKKTFLDTISGSVDGNAGTATKLATARTISASGDATGSASFDGSANSDIALTLANSGVSAGTYTNITVDAKGRATVGAQASLSDLSSPTSTFSFGGQVLSNLANPVNDTDATNKAYVDSVAQGLSVKDSCIVATTGNITLSGEQLINGVDVVAGNRVLVKNQTNTYENGIYVASASVWARATDANTWDELVSAFTFIEEGTTLADTGWVCTIDAGGTLGTDPVIFAQFSGAGTYLAGTGLTLTGNTFNITNTGVTADTYGTVARSITATVNAQGQITSMSDAEIALDCGTF